MQNKHYYCLYCLTCMIKNLAHDIFFNWNLLSGRLNSHCNAQSYKKKKRKKIKAYRKSVQREPTVNILQSKNSRVETVDIDILVTSKNGDRKMMVYHINEQTTVKNKEVEPVEPVKMNIYQSNTYRKDLIWLHLDDEPSVQERLQVKD